MRTNLEEWVLDARRQSLRFLEVSTDEQLLGPRMYIINPLLWEIGHVAWFQEKWVLRHLMHHTPLRDDADALYDSASVPHDSRWSLRLPGRDETRDYALRVRDAVLQAMQQCEGEQLDYFLRLSVFHEDMHTEAFTYTRQTLGFSAPPQVQRRFPSRDAAGGLEAAAGDVSVPGGVFCLGSDRGSEFVFDNEKWSHPVEVAPFQIARHAVTQGEFAEFVEAGGYRQRSLWSDAGWAWRDREQVQHPVYWRRLEGAWQRRVFDEWQMLEPSLPVMHVNYYEAEAFCCWAGRRLPTELEWEVAAAGVCDPQGNLLPTKRPFPWGEQPIRGPASAVELRANLDWRGGGTIDVRMLPAGDSAVGCRQMMGNVWEWTATDFQPYPDFEADPYREYSLPWFGTHKVLRGGCWATRSRLLRNTWRNFYTADRRDIWAGFRTCRST